MTAPDGDVDDVLRGELLGRAADDQDARLAHAGLGSVGDWSVVEAVDAANVAFLAPVIAERGWLGADVVGVDGAHACWLLVQHAPSELQVRWLPLLEAAVEAGNASAVDLAYLQDRVDMHADHRQHHGTQYRGIGDGSVRLWPMTDPDQLNARRGALGLAPVAAEVIAAAWTEHDLARVGRYLTLTPDRTAGTSHLRRGT